MLKIGLTGGIGSGKTTVAHIFEVLGIPVYYADDAAKLLMNAEGPLKQRIITHFGAQSYIDGKLNRAYLAKEIFSDTKKTTLINSIIHPATITDANNWMAAQTTTYAIKEAALIFEAKVHLHLDAVIGVYAPAALRIKRVMQRDNITEVQVEARMQKQMNEDEKMKRCNYVITNDDAQLLIPQVLEIHKLIMKKARL